MVKYWLPDGKVLASGWVNSGLEILPEKSGTVLGKNKTNGWLCRPNRSLSEVLSFWWNLEVEVVQKKGSYRTKS